MKNIIESYLQLDKSVVSRSLMRCKKVQSNEEHFLKLAVELLLIPLQVVFFELSSELLELKLETDTMKKKAEKLHQNQKHNKNTPKGANVIFELQVKNM